jgi:hypothetical protein
MQTPILKEPILITETISNKTCLVYFCLPLEDKLQLENGECSIFIGLGIVTLVTNKAMVSICLLFITDPCLF